MHMRSHAYVVPMNGTINGMMDGIDYFKWFISQIFLQESGGDKLYH